MMKKTLLSLILTLSILLIGGITANAEEPITSVDSDTAIERFKMDPEERFNARIDKMTDNQEQRISERTANFEEKKAEAVEGQAFKLSLVETYAADLYEDYAAAFEAHTAVHIILFNTHTELNQEAFNTTIDGLTDLKDVLFEQAEAGEITYKEAGHELAAYLEAERAYYNELRDQYKEDIAELNAENELRKEEVDLLKADLRAAIEAGDAETAGEIIAELYTYLELHTAYDEAKLEILEAVEF